MCQGSSLDKPDMGKPPEEWGPAEQAEYQRSVDEMNTQLDSAVTESELDDAITALEQELAHYCD